MATTPRPVGLYDREDEWADLDAFANRPGDAPQIGVVYGRRRQGKSYLLDHLAQAQDGFHFQALEETRPAALASLYQAATTWSGQTLFAGGRFENWTVAFRTLAEEAQGRLIVIDELPYLLRDSAELPSVLQAAFDAAKAGRHPSFRLILCGSALSVMTELLSGTKALRGRARLDMPIGSFDFRRSRAFWGIEDHVVAFLTDAVVGGPPGYKDLLDAPARTTREFEDWLAGGVLNPSHALFREADYLLTEDPSMTDRALYRSIIASIAEGHATRRSLTSDLARKDGLLDYPLAQLEKAHFIVRDHDLLRANRPLLRVLDPILRFSFTVLRRDIGRFAARQTHVAWTEARPRFDSQVLGPHFEAMARVWTRSYASDRTIGGPEREVGFIQVNDPVAKQAFELDVAVVARGGGATALRAIGEAKGGASPRTIDDLRRLDRLRSLLAARTDTSSTKLLLFGRSGFQEDVVAAAAGRSDIELIDLERMYERD